MNSWFILFRSKGGQRKGSAYKTELFVSNLGHLHLNNVIIWCSWFEWHVRSSKFGYPHWDLTRSCWTIRRFPCQQIMSFGVCIWRKRVARFLCVNTTQVSWLMYVYILLIVDLLLYFLMFPWCNKHSGLLFELLA